MVKGNLYTHLVRHHDKRIDILFELKQAFRTYPKDLKLIKKLRYELFLITSKKKKQTHKKKLYKSIFNGYYSKDIRQDKSMFS
ncbi:MAG: hypothetical protein AABY22_06505 [Nanoarchaeota archaeon]|mgnify:CR=1 FL=1